MKFMGKRIGYALCALFLCALFEGCTSAVDSDAVSAQYNISADGQLGIVFVVDKSAMNDAAWETLQEADAEALEANIDAALEDSAFKLDRVDVQIGKDKLRAEYRFARLDGLVFEDMAVLSEESGLKDIDAYLNKQKVITRDGGEIAISKIPDEGNTLVYLQDDIFDANIFDELFTALPVGLKDSMTGYLTIPGNVQYTAAGFEVAGYDWLKDETTLKVTSPETILLIAQPGLSFKWKIVIAAIAAILIVACVLIALIRHAARRRNRGTVLGAAGEYKDARFKLKAGEEVVFGRDASLCSVVLSNQSGLVSRTHCGIRYDKTNNVYYVKDYSTNGTFLRDGSRLRVNQDNVLKSGTLIYLGSRDTMFRLL